MHCTSRRGAYAHYGSRYPLYPRVFHRHSGLAPPRLWSPEDPAKHAPQHCILRFEEALQRIEAALRHLAGLKHLNETCRGASGTC